MRWLRGKEMKDKKVKRKKSVKVINNENNNKPKITKIKNNKEHKDSSSSDSQEDMKKAPVNITIFDTEETNSYSEKDSIASDKDSTFTDSISIHENTNNIKNRNLLKVTSKSNLDESNRKTSKPIPIRTTRGGNAQNSAHQTEKQLMEQRRKAAMLKRNNEKVGRFINPPTKYDKIRRRSECSVEDLSRLGISSLQPSPMSSGGSSMYNSWETISMTSPTAEKTFDLSQAAPLLRHKLLLTKQISRSSLIWSGETSRHLPSSIEIYPTMPPNRYLPATPNDLISSDQQDSGNNFDFVVHLNISQYGPDEILVTLEDGKVVVNGKHFSESEYGFESCQFHRQYPIPDGIKKADIKSKISEEGILTITAKRSDIKTRNLQQARRGSRDLELLNLPARSFSTGHDERPVTPVLKSPSPRSPSSPSNLRTESDFKEMNATTYHAKIQCAGYKPEDLDVRVSDMELIVSGRQRINSGDKQVKHKEFTKTLTLPYDADPSSITSRFLQSVLHIEVSRLSRRASTGNILNTL